MTRHIDMDDIEAGIETERASLVSTLGELQDRISIENLAQEALGLIRTNASAYTQAIDRAVRANPLALALAGAGIAWLVFGARKAPHSEVGRAVKAKASKAKHAAAEAEDGWSDAVDDLRSRASATLHDLEVEALAYAADVRAGLASGLDTARDFAAERAEVLAEFTQGMTTSFMSGLEGLSETTRERMLGLREQAYAARLRAERMASSGGHEAKRLIEDHPLISAGLALALGAALAAALPRGRGEERAVGGDKKRLMDEAAREVRRERDVAVRVTKAAGDKAKIAVRSAAKSAAHLAETKTKAVSAASKKAVSKAAEVADKVAEAAND